MTVTRNPGRPRKDPDGAESRFTEWYKENRERRIAYMRDYRALRREECRAYGRKYAAKARDEHPARFMLIGARTRAAKRGKPCTILVEDIKIPTHCPVLGMALVVNKGTPAHNSPSLDCIDPDKGYVPGNVWVISHRANSMKNDAGPEELRKFCLRMLEVLDAN